MNRAVNAAIARSKSVERALVGEPVLIRVRRQDAEVEAMQREGITPDQLDAALREHGISGLDGVRMCVLEVDGSISVVPRESTVLKTRHHYRGLRLP